VSDAFPDLSDRAPRWPCWVVLFCLGTLVPALLLAAVQAGGAPIVGWEEPGKYLRISEGLLEHGRLVEERPLYGEDVAGTASAERVLVPALERLPAFPVFVAALWRIAWPGSYLWIATVQCLLGGVFAVAMAAAATALRPGWFWPAGLLACVWPNVQWQATIVMPEMLLAATLAAGLAAALWLPRACRPWLAAAVSAIGFGIAFMTKPQLILLSVVLGPALWWYLARAGLGRGRAAALAAVPVAAMLALAGVQVGRVHAAHDAWLFTTHSNDHALFFVWPCLSTPLGCGDPNLVESRRALADFRARVDPLPPDARADPIVLNRIKGEIFRSYIAAADKLALARSVAGSYVKLLFHTVVLSAVDRFGGTLSYLSTTPGAGLQRLANFAGAIVSDPGMLVWAVAQTLLVLSRVVQGIGAVAGLGDRRRAPATLLLLACATALLAVSAGIGNPRYRVAAEPMLLLLTVAGGDALWRLLNRKAMKRAMFPA